MSRIAQVRYLLAVFSAAALVGCSGPRPTPSIEREMPDAFPYHSAETILFNVSAAGEALQSVRARGSATIRTPQQRGQFAVDLRSRRGDSTYVSISPGLGIEAARVLVTPDSFYFYDRLKNRLVFGSMENAEGVLPQPFATDDIFANLLGLAVPSPGIEWSVSADSSHYVLVDPTGLRTYVVDPAFWRVTRYEKRDATGTLLEEYVFSEFDSFDGAVLPRRVAFRRPSEESSATIYYRSIEVNPNALTFDLGVRSTATRVRAGG